MKRRVVKELDNSIYAIDIMLYTIMSMIGFLLLQFSLGEVKDASQFIISSFFIFGFFSLLAYFLNRRPNDYEFLFFGFINVCVASFATMNHYSGDIELIISNSFIFYTIAYFINKAIHVYKLFRSQNINFIPKCAITILIVFLTLFTMITICSKVEVALMIYGYYFIAFGLLSLIEVVLIVIINAPKIRKKIINILDYDEIRKSKKTVVKKIKPINDRRITPKKIKVDEEIISSDVKPSKKKKSKKAN